MKNKKLSVGLVEENTSKIGNIGRRDLHSVNSETPSYHCNGVKAITHFKGQATPPPFCLWHEWGAILGYIRQWWKFACHESKV